MHKIVLSLCLVLALSAAADDFNDRLEAANELLKSGATAKALEAYRDLQVDRPESDILQYSIGCAQYMDAMADLALEAREDAATAFNEATDSFEKVQTSANADVRCNAGYNRANALAQTAKLSLPAEGYSPQTVNQQDYEKATKAFIAYYKRKWEDGDLVLEGDDDLID